MSEDPKVSGARIEVERSKAALLDTASRLLERFQPHNLVDDIWEQAKIKGADLAEDAVDAVAKRPVAVGGAIAALAMFLAREPLKKATVKFYDVMTPLFEPRTKPAALKPKSAGAKKATATAKTPQRRRTRSPSAKAAKKTEKA